MKPKYSKRERYVQLERMDIQTEASVAEHAVGFFSLRSAYNRHARIENLNEPLTPAASEDFVDYLQTNGILKDAQKYIYQIRDILARLERSNILVSEPSFTGNPILPRKYFTFHEVSVLRRQGILWLAKALGGRFLYDRVSPIVVHIVGKRNGVESEGSGIVFADQHVLTCRHVVEGMDLADQQQFQGKTVNIIDTFPHSKFDIAVIKTKESLSPVPGLIFFRPEVSQKIYRFGCARIPCSIPNIETSPTMESGEVTLASVPMFDGSELFLYSAVSRPGDSGGAIVSEEGYIVGMTSESSDARYTGSEHGNQTIFWPHYAGLPADVIATAVKELPMNVHIPYETFE